MKPDDMRWTMILSHRKTQKAIIAREFSASRMSKTKWMELNDALDELSLRYRIKFVDEDAATEWGWLFSPVHGYLEHRSYGPFRTFSIEWLEIDPFQMFGEFGRLVDCDYLQEIQKRLGACNIPFEIVGSCIRIVGHVRKMSAAN